jgi:hypothetical protein
MGVEQRGRIIYDVFTGQPGFIPGGDV